MMMMMMMMMMNCFGGMVDRQKVLSLISSGDLCQRSSPSRISAMPQARFEPAQNLSSGLVEKSCAVAITAAPWCHKCRCISKWLDIKGGHQRCQVVRCYGASMMSVLFRYQLKRLWHVLSWSASFRYQLIRRYDVSNWSVYFTYQWDVTKTS